MVIELVGMHYQDGMEAIAKMGLRCRISHKDGAANVLTLDYWPMRVNLVVKRDIIISAFLG